MARIEILAPVGSEEMLRAAVFSGADAVYLGFSGFNARTGAGNFDADSLQEAVRFCHARGVAVHVALNTTVYGTELPALEQAIRAVAASGAGFFTIVAVVLWLFLPRRPANPAGVNARAEKRTADVATRVSWPALRDRNFVVFAVLHASDLVAYNQLYFAVPLELSQLHLGADTVATMFVWVSIVTFGAQLPLARWAAHVGAAAALRTGYLVTATGFLVVGAAAIGTPPRAWHLSLIMVTVTCLIVGHLIANPTALSTVPKFSAGRPTGTYFGLLASLGGIAVLLAGLVTGALFDSGGSLSMNSAGPYHTFAQALPWLFLAALSTIAAIYGPRRVAA